MPLPFTYLLFICSLIYYGVTLRLAAQEEPTIPPCPAQFLMDAIVSSQGDIWVASENDGVWKLNSTTQEWQNMSQVSGFPKTKNCYAIEEDLQHRIWVGTDNQGAIVWNGESWKQYTQIEGLIGERVFDIATNPLCGTIAIATSAGITLYEPKTDTWRDITRAEGIIEDQVESLCFTPEGKLFLGYACGGTSISSSNTYHQWVHSQAKWFWDKKQYIRQPLTYAGEGLPSNLCNVVLAPSINHFWVGTTSGIAKSTNGRNWNFLRGADTSAKNEGLYGGIPPGTNKAKPSRTLLPEDFITALLPCPEGLWVGFREKGACLIDPSDMRIKAPSSMLNNHKNARAKWVRRFLRLPAGEILAATNGGGIQKIGNSKAYSLPPYKRNNPTHPSFIPPPSDREIAQRIQKMNSPPSPPLSAAFLYEDWATQGNWCQRYGRRYGILCAANTPMGDMSFHFDRTATKNQFNYDVWGCMGPNRSKGDSLRHWIQWINAPNNHNVLYNPFYAIRTEAEWDDQGEAYKRHFDGPDVWAIVNVPAGVQTISLYFYNPNGREAANGYRDYIVELRKVSTQVPENKREANIKEVLSLPVQARTRVNHFSGSGVYKTFIVQGGNPYYIRIGRNYSMNTILNGVFLNSWKELDPFNYLFGHPYSTIPPNPPNLENTNISLYPASALQLWIKTLKTNSLSSEPLFFLRKNLLLAYRRNQAEIKSPENPLLQNWRWQFRLWLPQDYKIFNDMLQADWSRKQDENPFFRSSQHCQYSPNVIPFSEEELCLMKYHKIDWKQFLPHGNTPTQQDILLMRKKLKNLHINQ